MNEGSDYDRYLMIMFHSGAESGKGKRLSAKGTHTGFVECGQIGSGSQAQTENNGMA